MSQRCLVHGTTVAVDGLAVLLRGPSGSGKSDLALRLIDEGAALVSDDLTELVGNGRGLVARPPGAAPADTRGRIEARGLGIVAVDTVAEAPLALVADLADGASVERLPEPSACDYLGVAVPRIALRPFEASAAAKRLALRAAAATRTEAKP
jgi:serine kinase of HPr protein (carbohydrate metabolism regulator)